MVAVVSGNGLGLLNGSLSQLGLVSGAAAGLGQSRDRQYVNTANGNLVIQGADASLVFNGISLSDLRTYNSEGTGSDQGWLWGFSRKVYGLTGTVNTAGSTISREADDGSTLTYAYDTASATYRSTNEAGAKDTLTWSASTSKWTWTEGESRRQETYNSTGALTNVSDPVTGGSYTLAYANGHLSTVTATDGDVLTFGYDAQGRLTSLSTTEIPPGSSTAVTRVAVSYGYDSMGRLSTVSTSLASDSQSSTDSFTSTYQYDGTSMRVARVTQSDGAVVAYVYGQQSDGSYRVTQITTGVGSDASTQTVSYANVTESGVALTATTITDASGRAWTYKANAAGRLVSMVSPAVNGQQQVTTYTYDASNNLLSVTDPVGNKTTYNYDVNGNCIFEQDQAGDTITRTYSAHDQLLTETTYRTPTPGATPTSSSTPETVRYVYDTTDHLRFVLDAKGDVTERQYDATGKLLMTRQFVGAKYSIGSLALTATPTLAQMTTWSNARDLTQTLRTDYTYDARGLLASSRSYASVNSAGNGVVDTGTSTTTFVYDAQGQLRQTAVTRGSSSDLTTYAYDGLGRIIATVSATGAKTTWVYGSSGTVTQVTVDASGSGSPATGSVRNDFYNSRGDLVSTQLTDPSATQVRTTQYVYDSTDQLRAVVQPDGSVAYNFYDAAGRLAMTVDPTGAVTEYARDADGRLTGTTGYATRVDTSTWLNAGVVVPTSAAAVRPATSTLDRTTHVTYDTAGRVATTTDATGTVTTNTYDGESNLTKVVVGTGTDARTTRYFYDAVGQVTATLDADGYLTETTYDEAGHVIQTVAYSTPTPVAKRAAGTVAQLRPAESWDDQTTTYFYDAQGRVMGTLDGESYFTRYLYNDSTHTVSTTRYALKLDDRADSSWATLTGLTSGTPGQTTVTRFDANGNKILVTNAEGTQTRNTFDALGRLVQTDEAFGSADLRTRTASYDGFGELIRSVDGEGKATTYTYDVEGRETSRTDPLGQTTWSVYDADGQLRFTVVGEPDASGALNRQGEVTQYTYDAFGDVAQTTVYATRLSVATTGPGTLAALSAAAIAIADPVRDGTTHAVYDARGRILQSVDPNGNVTAFTYDAFGDLATTTHQYGPGTSTTTAFTYDKRGDLLTTTEDVGGIKRLTQSTWDAFGRVVTSTDGRGAVLLHEYDDINREVGQVLTVYGDDLETVTRYDAFGRALSVTQPGGQTTTFAYSDANRTMTTTTPEGVVVTTTHNREGQTVSVTDGANQSTSYVYDHEGRLLSSTDATGGTASSVYDAAGHIILATDAAGRAVAYTYDAAGRVLTRTVDPQGLALTTRYAYDGRGQAVTMTDPTGTVTQYTFDAAGNVTSQRVDAATGGLGLTTTYTYDAQGNQLTVTQGAGTADATTTRFVYDALGRVMSRIVDDGRLALTTHYVYDANDHVVASTDPAGATTYYNYDEHGLLIFTVEPVGANGASTGRMTRYNYDVNGALVSTRVLAQPVDTSGLAAVVASDVSTARNAMFALLESTATDADASSYRVLDADGRVQFTVGPDGSVVEYRYDTLGRLAGQLAYDRPIVPGGDLTVALRDGTASVDDLHDAMTQFGLTEANAHQSQFYYDASGRLRFTVARDQVGGQTVGTVTEDRYNAAGDLIATIVHATALSAAQLTQTQTTASIDGLVHSDVGGNETDRFYDKAGRLVALRDADGGVSYTFYDADGRVSGTVDAAGALVAFTYDAAGRLTSKTAYDTPLNTAAWLAGGAVTVSLATVLPQPQYPGQDLGRTTTFQYDSLGRLVRQDTALNGFVQGETQSIRYTYDGASRVTAVTTMDVIDGDEADAASHTTREFYDADGRVVATLDPMNYLVEYVYDAAGHVTRTIAYATAVATDSDGNPVGTTLATLRPASNAADEVTTSFYDAQGRLTGSLDAQRYFTSYAYDVIGQLLSSTRYATAVPAGTDSDTGIRQALSGTASRSSSTTYDVYGRVASQTDAQGTVTVYVYDARGHVLSTVTALGTSDSRTQSATYDAEGRMVTSVDGLGHTTTYAYDAAGRLIETTDPLGNHTWFVNDADGRVVYAIRGVADAGGNPNALGEITATTYDAFGDVASRTTYAKRAAISTLGAFTAATLGSVVSTLASYASSQPTIGAGPDDATTNRYDDLGNLIEAKNGGSQVSEYGFDAFGNLTFTMKAGGSEVEGCGYSQDLADVSYYRYDADGRRIGSYEGVSANFIGEYTSFDSAIDYLQNESWDPTDPNTYSSYDGAAALVTLSTFDAFGNQTSSTDGRGIITEYGYDHLGQRVSTTVVTTQGHQTVSTAYDAFHRLASVTDAMGHTTTYRYDDTARTMLVTSPLGVTMATAYDRYGQSISVRDAAGHGTVYSYDADGRLLSTTDATGGGTTSTYDGVGHVIDTVDAAGRRVHYTYDAVGRVLTQTVDPDGLALVTRYSYDGTGHLITQTDPTGTVTAYGYDWNGNQAVIVKDYGDESHTNLATYYRFNAAGQVVAVVNQNYYNSPFRTYSYDALGRLVQVGDGTGGPQSRSLEANAGESSHSYQYDQSGNLSYETDGAGNPTAHIYDENNREILTIQLPYGGEGSSMAVTQRVYDADGNIVATRRYDEQYNNDYAFQLMLVNPWSGGWDQKAQYGLNNISQGLNGESTDLDQITYSVFDADGRKVYDVDNAGYVTEYRYDPLGRVQQTLVYNGAVSIQFSQLLYGGSLTAGNVASALAASSSTPAATEQTLNYYDDAGRIRFQVKVGPDGGHVTETGYNAAGQVVSVRTYTSPVTASVYAAGSTTQSVASAMSSLAYQGVRTFYDGAGRKVYEVDAAGDVKEWRYDGAGRQTWALSWLHPVSVAAAATTGDVASAIQAANPLASDVRGTGVAYNAIGLAAASFDALNGAPTVTYTYDYAGLLSRAYYADGSIHAYTYDQDQRLIYESVDAVPFVLYDVAGHVIGTYPSQSTTAYRYDGNGRLIEKSVSSDFYDYVTVDYQYDFDGNLTSTSTSGRLVEESHDGSNDDPSQVYIETQAQYDRLGNKVEETDAAGRTTFHAYDTRGNVMFDIDPDGYVTQYSYDAENRLVATTRYAEPIDTTAISLSDSNYLATSYIAYLLEPSTDDRTLQVSYDVYGNKVQVTEPQTTYVKADGTSATGTPTTRYTYNAAGQVTSESVLTQGTADGPDAVWSTTYTYYDAAGRKAETVDPMGYVTTWTYDTTGQVLSTTESARAIDPSSLVAGGQPPASPAAGDASTGFDRVTTYTYNAEGRVATQSSLRSVAQAGGGSARQSVIVAYGYDSQGRVTTVTTNGHTVTTTYDVAGRIASVTGPQESVLVDNWQAMLAADSSLTLDSPSLYHLSAEVVTYRYDILGHEVTETHTNTANGTSATTYFRNDALGRVIASLAPADGQTDDWTSPLVHRMTYDNVGNLLTTAYTLVGTDGASTTVTTTNTYDNQSRLVSTVTQRSGEALPDASKGNEYDAFGEVIGTGTATSVNAVATYDAAGRLVSGTDPKTGINHTYGYNLAGQLVSDSWPGPDGAGNVTIHYTRDLDGRVTAETTPTAAGYATLTASYDRWSNVLSSTDARGGVTSYQYDELNHVVSETGPAVEVVSANGTAQTVSTTTLTTYDADGNVSTVTDANGYGTRTWHDALGRVTKVVDGAGATQEFAYDAMGNQVLDQDGNGNLTFLNYDALGHVVQQGDYAVSGGTRTAVWRQAYVLDESGNRLKVYDGTGAALLQAGNTTQADAHANWYGFDSQGRVVWSQDQAQHAASTADHTSTGSWSNEPYNALFDDGSEGWTAPAGYTFSNGAVSFNSATTDSANIVNNDRVPVSAGQVIHATASIRATGVHGGGAVMLLWYDKTGAYLGATDDASITTIQEGLKDSEVTGTAPPGAAFMQIGVNTTGYSDLRNTVTVYGVTWDYVPPVWATSTNADGQVVVSLPSGSFTMQPTNPDFENGDSGWVKGNGWSITNGSGGYNGSKWAAQLDTTGATNSQITNGNRVPVKPGQVINASAMVQQGASDVGDTGAAIQILWYDANGNLLSTSTGNYVDSGKHGNWHPTNVRGTAPPGAAFAQVAVDGWNHVSGQPLWVDGITWDYQYVLPQRPGLVQTAYTYDVYGNQTSETTADGDTQTSQYDAFGRVLSHTDLSGATYNYAYDANTEQLTGESDNWNGQSASTPAYVTGPVGVANSSTRTYYANGQVKSITYADGSFYNYEYDADGNVTRAESSTHDGNNVLVHEATATTYDSHNRVSHIVTTNLVTNAVTLDETYRYDAVGNRREIQATSGGTTKDAWYTYDGDNRVLVSAGHLVNGAITVSTDASSYALGYDGAGNTITRMTLSAAGDVMMQRSFFDSRNQLYRADYAVDTTTGGASQGIEELRTYDENGRQTSSVQLYALGTTLGNRPDGKPNPDGETAAGSGLDISGQLSTAVVDRYDAYGRLLEEQNFGHPDDWNGTGGSTTVPTGLPDPDSSTYGSLTLTSSVVYQGPDGAAGYDAVGNKVFYQYREASGRADQYTVTYIKKDTYLEATTSGQNVTNTPNVRPTTDESFYDRRGNRVAIAQHIQYTGGAIADTVRVFAYDANGEIIERRDGTASGANLDQGSNAAHENQHYVYVNGEQVAHYDEGGTLDVLSQVTAFSSGATSGYVVQTGDTLKSIAQAVYGNASLWYVIAQANAIDGDSQLAVGQDLTIPEVKTNQNDSTTYKPYNGSEITGSTTPGLPTILPPPPPPSGGHCSTLAMIIVIAVTVVVTIVTYGATSELLAGELGTFGAAVAAGAVAGAAGSIAGQLTGNALGTQQGFSWSQVAEGAIGGAIGGGVSAELGQIGSLQSATSVNGLNAYGNAIAGAADYVGSYESAKLTGEAAHFSWAGLVASSASAVASSEFGPSVNDTRVGSAAGTWAQGVESRAVGDVVNREVSVGLGDNHVQSWRSIGEDVAGYAAGSYVGNRLNASVTNAIREREAREQAQEQAVVQGNLQKMIDQQSARVSSDIEEMGVVNDAREQAGAGSINPDNARVVQGDIADQDALARPFAYMAEPSGATAAAPTDVRESETYLPAPAAGPLAGKAVYEGNYVDPYLIARNGGDVHWKNEVDWYAAPDQAPAVVEDHTPVYAPDAPAPGAAVEDATRHASLVVAGAVASVVVGTKGAIVSGLNAAGNAGGFFLNASIGRDGIFGYQTDYFEGEADATGALLNHAGNGISSIADHPLDSIQGGVQGVSSYLAQTKDAYSQAITMAMSDDPDVANQGYLQLGQQVGNTVQIADAGLGLLKGATVVAAGTGLFRTEKTVDELVQSVRPDDAPPQTAESGIDRSAAAASSEAGAAPAVNALRSAEYDTVPNTTAEAAGAPTFTAQPGYQILYRGTAEQPTQFLSDVAATKGVDASDAMIASAENGGSVSYLFENHAATSQGSPYISLSSSEEVAEFFARGPGGDQSGFVNVFQVPHNFAEPNFENANVWEREYLAPTKIPDQYLIHRYQVTSQDTP
jgi:YD repeat-containing protein